MRKDTEALRSSGGTGVQSKSFNPNDLAQDVAFTPPVDAASKVATPKNKTLFISIGIIVVLALAVAAVYFFVLPLFSSNTPEVVIDDTPVADEQVPPPIVPAFIHQSFFTDTPSASIDATLTTASLSEMNLAMQGSGATNGTEEFIFTVGVDPVTAQDAMGLLLPGLDSTAFNEDLTTFLHHDENGAWPGYVFLLSDGADANLVSLAVADEVESGANLNAFYLTAPGAADEGVFQNGSVNGISTRYLPLGVTGASFNYGWSGNYLILSASFNGFKEASALLEEVAP